jgi:hypothetical protein
LTPLRYNKKAGVERALPMELAQMYDAHRERYAEWRLAFVMAMLGPRPFIKGMEPEVVRTILNAVTRPYQCAEPSHFRSGTLREHVGAEGRFVWRMPTVVPASVLAVSKEAGTEERLISNLDTQPGGASRYRLQIRLAEAKADDDDVFEEARPLLWAVDVPVPCYEQGTLGFVLYLGPMTSKDGPRLCVRAAHCGLAPYLLQFAVDVIEDGHTSAEMRLHTFLTIKDNERVYQEGALSIALIKTNAPCFTRPHCTSAPPRPGGSAAGHAPAA